MNWISIGIWKGRLSQVASTLSPKDAVERYINSFNEDPLYVFSSEEIDTATHRKNDAIAEILRLREEIGKR